ncbi:hypothetical protein J4466_02520 [Candidatus Pacearchaeota archaeon]|nr:hypothetical protein [Candidatus Pacearchaeota archaeon]
MKDKKHMVKIRKKRIKALKKQIEKHEDKIKTEKGRLDTTKDYWRKEIDSKFLRRIEEDEDFLDDLDNENYSEEK